jgi:hypothetical protein
MFKNHLLRSLAAQDLRSFFHRKEAKVAQSSPSLMMILS